MDDRTRAWIILSVCGVLLACIVALSIQQRMSSWQYESYTPPTTTAAQAAPAQETRHATLVGYDEAGSHITDIWLHAKPAGSSGVNPTVFTAHEGDRVEILEQRASGAVKVRTAGGAEGWTQGDALTDIR